MELSEVAGVLGFTENWFDDVFSSFVDRFAGLRFELASDPLARGVVLRDRLVGRVTDEIALTPADCDVGVDPALNKAIEITLGVIAGIG